MEEWGNQRHLKLDLLTTQHRCRRQSLDLSKSARELFYSLNQRRIK
jgi:hypothetical protein